MTDREPDKYSFCTDLHGNLKNIDEFLRMSAERGTELIIFGGDLMPKKIALETSDGLQVPQNGFLDLLSTHHNRDEKALNLAENSSVRLAKDGELFKEGYIAQKTEVSSQLLIGLPSFLKKISILLDENPMFIPFSEQDLRYIQENGEEFVTFFFNNNSQIVGRLNMSSEECAKGVQRFVAYHHFINSHGHDLQSVQKSLAEFFGVEGDDGRELIRETLSFSSNNLDALFRMIYVFYKNVFENLTYKKEFFANALRGQRLFLKEFFKKIGEYKQNFRTEIALILGNDDMIETVADLNEAERRGLFTNVTNRVFQFQGMQMMGYSFVPPLDFAYTSWFSDEQHIADDLRVLALRLRRDVGRTIFNIHCSPADTALSKAFVNNCDRLEYGSAAIRDFIRNNPATLSLHGHTHESWRITGQVDDKIGQTRVINPGASEFEGRFLFGNLSDPDNFDVMGFK